jgi:hypothetical protein
MAGRPKGGQISEADFSTLLGALSSTAKGRAFLAEYRRRARPNETLSLLDSLQRIEATIGTVRDQLQPERIADELRRVAMTLEIAIEGASTDLAGEEGARRIALIERGRSELTSVAESLAGGPLAGHEVTRQIRSTLTQNAEDLATELRLLDQLAGPGPAAPER